MTWRRSFEFTGEEPFFQGHFPGLPVLPGVVQLSLAREFAEAALGIRTPLKEVRKMKFMRVIVPGRQVTLEIVPADGANVGYVFKEGERTCSSGLLVY